MTKLWVSYLSLSSPPTRDQPRHDACVIAARLTLDEYLDLYKRVGGPWGWDQRLQMERGELERLLDAPHCHIYVLLDAALEQRLGFCEFDSSGWPDVQLMNFGLLPEAFGRGLGPWFLNRSIENIWNASSPRRIWLHTDTNDHPKARDVYLRAGFQVDDVRWEDAKYL